MENVPSVIRMNDIVSNSRLFHTASMVMRNDLLMTLPPLKEQIVSGDKLWCLKCASFGPIYYFDKVMCTYRKHNSGLSSVVKLSNLKKDKNIAYYMKSIYPQFPQYRYLSFLYGTFAMYPKNISVIRKIWYLTISFVLSFSFFPDNFKVLVNKIIKTKKYQGGK